MKKGYCHNCGWPAFTYDGHCTRCGERYRAIAQRDIIDQPPQKPARGPDISAAPVQIMEVVIQCPACKITRLVSDQRAVREVARYGRIGIDCPCGAKLLVEQYKISPGLLIVEQLCWAKEQ